MAGEHTESETHTEGTNGVSKSGANSFATARAAFLAGESGGEATTEDKAKPAKPVSREVADDDSDLDADDDVDAEREVSNVDDDADLDADLDEDEDKSKPADEDDETKTGIDKVRHTEKRMREQLKKERSDAEVEIRQLAHRAEQEIEQKWRPRIEAAEKFEKLAQRAAVDPVAALQALGVKEDDYEHISKVFFTLHKAKDDPKARAVAAQLVKARERDAEIDDLKKWREDREKTEKEREEQAAADRRVDAYIGSVEKAVGDKTPLAKVLMKNDRDGALEELQSIALKLARENGGAFVEAKKVAIAFEKHQRAKLRKLGIDPKSRGAAAAIVADAKGDKEKAATTAMKKGDDKSARKDSTEKPSKSLRERFIAGD